MYNINILYIAVRLISLDSSAVAEFPSQRRVNCIANLRPNLFTYLLTFIEYYELDVDWWPVTFSTARVRLDT